MNGGMICRLFFREQGLTPEHHCYYTTVKDEIQPLFRKSKDLLIYITGCRTHDSHAYPDLKFEF